MSKEETQIDEKTQEFISEMQMCSFLMNLSSDIEKIGMKLHVPHYRIRERDKEIKNNLDSIYQIVLSEGEESCKEATIKLQKLIRRNI